MIDIPTALTAGETRLLESLANGRTLAEAGSLLGYSTVAMARVAKRVIAVDPHQGYPEFAPRSTYDSFLDNIRRYGVADRVVPVVGTAAGAFPRLAADVCFLDLTGGFDLTYESIGHALRVSPVVAVHDYQRGGCDGATEAVDLSVRQWGLQVSRRDTLVVLERKWPNGE